MFITVHAAVGALVGTEITNPWLSFSAGVILHFLLDIIPHGDRELGKKFFGLVNKKITEEDKIKSLAAYGLLDCLVLVLFLFFAIKNYGFIKDDNVVWAMIGSIIPDFIVALYVLTRSKCLKWFFEFHRRIHHLAIGRMANDISVKSGIVMQIAVLIVLLLLLRQVDLFGPYF